MSWSALALLVVVLMAPAAHAQTLLTSAPDVTSQGPGELDIFVRGSNEELLQNHHDYRTGSWSGWYAPLTPFGTDSMSSSPGAASFGNGQGFDVLARGMDNVLHHGRIRDGVQHPLHRLTGYVNSGPDAAAMWGRLDVVACGPTNELMHWIHNAWAQSWSDALPLAGPCTAGPAIATPGGDLVLEVFTRGPDGAVHQRTFSGEDPRRPQWGQWRRIEGFVTSGLDATSSGDVVHLFARGSSNELLHNRQQNGTWSGWQSLGGDLTSDPTAISAEPGRIDVFARCAEDALHHWSFSHGAWRLTNLGDCSTGVYEAEGPDEILDDDFEDPEVDPEPLAPAMSGGSQPVALTAQRETDALALLKRDARVRQILGGVRYSVDKIGPWTELADDGTQRLVGATLILDLPRPKNWSMTAWPQIGYGSKNGTYLKSTKRFAVAGATEVLVDIDLTAGLVVGVSPLGGIVTERPPGDRAPEPSPWRGD